MTPKVGFFLCILGILVPLLTATAEEIRPAAFGWIEPVRIDPGGVTLRAKLDTGADHSSIDAKNIQEFERNGRTWVRFEVRSAGGKFQAIEAPVERSIHVKRILGKAQSRTVIRLRICLGDRRMATDVSLVDRSNLSTPMLVGRDFLAGNAVVDPSKTMVSRPECLL